MLQNANNCGLEGINATIKAENTFREQLEMNEFLSVAGEIVYGWSHDRDPANPNAKRFETAPNITKITKKKMKKSYLWKKNSTIAKHFFDDYYACASSSQEIITEVKLNSYK